MLYFCRTIKFPATWYTNFLAKVKIKCQIIALINSRIKNYAYTILKFKYQFIIDYIWLQHEYINFRYIFMLPNNFHQIRIKNTAKIIFKPFLIFF